MARQYRRPRRRATCPACGRAIACNWSEEDRSSVVAPHKPPGMPWRCRGRLVSPEALLPNEGP